MHRSEILALIGAESQCLEELCCSILVIGAEAWHQYLSSLGNAHVVSNGALYLLQERGAAATMRWLQPA